MFITCAAAGLCGRCEYMSVVWFVNCGARESGFGVGMDGTTGGGGPEINVLELIIVEGKITLQ